MTLARSWKLTQSPFVAAGPSGALQCFWRLGQRVRPCRINIIWFVVKKIRKWAKDSKMDEVWRVLLGEGMLATLLSFGELTRLPRLNRSSRRLHDAAWRAIWRARSKACSGAELAHILRLRSQKGRWRT